MTSPEDLVGAPNLLQGLQLFPRLETDRLAGRYCHLSTCSGISSDAGLPWPHVEDTEAAEFNPITFAQGLFHAFEDCLHSHFGFRLGYTSPADNLVDDV
jgi:hypothetical protein